MLSGHRPQLIVENYVDRPDPPAYHYFALDMKRAPAELTFHETLSQSTSVTS